jgi:hypothetical protein
MSKHTVESRLRNSALKDGTAAGQALQPERAFVVQFHGGPARSRRCLQGRVEHVVSGEVARFASTTELIDFLTRLLAAADVSAQAPRSRARSAPIPRASRRARTAPGTAP